MEIFSLLGSVLTVVSFALFAGIVGWAFSKRRKEAFERAANEPFALPDDGGDPAWPRRRERAER
jgi:cytochrome c oxidase cbb3-type subunit 4